jgi:large subunit ribosomal protein L23
MKETWLKTILGPHISEKASMGAGDQQQCVFKVAIDANKKDIADAVEALFEVKVDSVRTVRVKGKTTRFKQIKGRRKDWKKAYVTLADGSHLDLFEHAA